MTQAINKLFAIINFFKGGTMLNFIKKLYIKDQKTYQRMKKIKQEREKSLTFYDYHTGQWF